MQHKFEWKEKEVGQTRLFLIKLSKKLLKFILKSSYDVKKFEGSPSTHIVLQTLAMKKSMKGKEIADALLTNT